MSSTTPSTNSQEFFNCTPELIYLKETNSFSIRCALESTFPSAVEERGSTILEVVLSIMLTVVILEFITFAMVTSMCSFPLELL